MTKYRELARLRVSHGFYASGESPDFRLEPLGRTAKALARHRLIFRPEPTGARLIGPLNDADAPLVALDERLDLYFGLRLANPAFSLFTELPPKATEAAYLFRVPAGGGVVLEQGEVVFARDTIPLAIDSASHAIAVTVTDLDGTEVLRELLPVLRTKPDDASGHVDHAVAVGALVPGLYTLRYGVGAAARQQLYFIGAAGGWFGIVHLRLDPADMAVPMANGPHSLVFTPRKETWDYVVVLSGDRRNGTYRISQGAGGAVDPALSFADPVEVAAEGNTRTLSIKSTAPVAFRERPRANLELQELKAVPAAPPAGPPAGPPAAPAPPTWEPVVAALPNPSPARARAEVRLYL